MADSNTVMGNSNTIYINLGNISNRSLDNAKNELEKALGYLRSLDSMDSQQYEDADGEMQLLFDGELASNAHASAIKIERILSRLEEYNRLLTSGPEALADIDANSKIPNSILRDIIHRSADIIGVVTPIEPKVKKIVEIRDYKDGVERGTIRYCNQNSNALSEKDRNGWSTNDLKNFNGLDGSDGKCNRAVESMGLSYIGIDVAPSDMQNVKGDDGYYNLDFATSTLSQSSNLTDAESKTCTVTASYNETTFEEMVKTFDDDDTYSVSPVMFHYKKDSGGEHWLMIIGTNKDEDGNITSYNAIGPWTSKYESGKHREKDPFVVEIKDGKITCDDKDWFKSGTIDKIAQYTRTDS